MELQGLGKPKRKKTPSNKEMIVKVIAKNLNQSRIIKVDANMRVEQFREEVHTKHPEFGADKMKFYLDKGGVYLAETRLLSRYVASYSEVLTLKLKKFRRPNSILFVEHTDSVKEMIDIWPQTTVTGVLRGLNHKNIKRFSDWGLFSSDGTEFPTDTLILDLKIKSVLCRPLLSSTSSSSSISSLADHPRISSVQKGLLTESPRKRRSKNLKDFKISISDEDSSISSPGDSHRRAKHRPRDSIRGPSEESENMDSSLPTPPPSPTQFPPLSNTKLTSLTDHSISPHKMNRFSITSKPSEQPEDSEESQRRHKAINYSLRNSTDSLSIPSPTPTPPLSPLAHEHLTIAYRVKSRSTTSLTSSKLALSVAQQGKRDFPSFSIAEQKTKEEKAKTLVESEQVTKKTPKRHKKKSMPIKKQVLSPLQTHKTKNAQRNTEQTNTATTEIVLAVNEEGKTMIVGGTIEKIMEKILDMLLTDSNRKEVFNFLHVFISGYRLYSEPEDILKMIIDLWNSTPPTEKNMELYQSRIRSSIMFFLSGWFTIQSQDFASEQVFERLKNFITSMPTQFYDPLYPKLAALRSRARSHSLKKITQTDFHPKQHRTSKSFTNPLNLLDSSMKSQQVDMHPLNNNLTISTSVSISDSSSTVATTSIVHSNSLSVDVPLEGKAVEVGSKLKSPKPRKKVYRTRSGDFAEGMKAKEGAHERTFSKTRKASFMNQELKHTLEEKKESVEEFVDIFRTASVSQIAKCWTDQDKSNFLKINRLEFIGKQIRYWERMLKRANTFSRWVASFVVHQKQVQDRVLAYQHMLELIDQFLLLGNYNGCMAVWGGLHAVSVKRLSKTISNITSKFHELLGSFKVRFSETGNFSPLQAEMDKRMNQGEPLIPWFELINKNRNMVLSRSSLLQDTDSSCVNLVNFERIRLIGEMMLKFDKQQKLISLEIQEKTWLSDYLKKLPTSTDDQLWECSLLLE
eukprot:TRINITY_DN10955_c0_g1_i1.p1 TRINITY_DN10955_c0_g1~~TRINITY_DN10955_c0_g1_i1.p1  ORF type:complete len:968 (+),score=224.27 TRINITY_DN10955_c0_g1_i1:3-2906(+)